MLHASLSRWLLLGLLLPKMMRIMQKVVKFKIKHDSGILQCIKMKRTWCCVPKGDRALTVIGVKAVSSVWHVIFNKLIAKCDRNFKIPLKPQSNGFGLSCIVTVSNWVTTFELSTVGWLLLQLKYLWAERFIIEKSVLWTTPTKPENYALASSVKPVIASINVFWSRKLRLGFFFIFFTRTDFSIFFFFRKLQIPLNLYSNLQSKHFDGLYLSTFCFLLPRSTKIH